jgi:acetyl esterase/lipase
MSGLKSALVLAVLSILFSLQSMAQEEYETVSLWNGKAAEATGTEPKDDPSGLLYKLPSSAQPVDAKGRACLVILPGGGYGNLAIDHEGHQIARWANSMGMVAFICKYRHRKDGYGHPVPMLDAQRAIRLARAKASEWGVDPSRVGILGFSAGGHLASTVLTHFDVGDQASVDPIAKHSARPDFGVLCYPVISMTEAFTHAGSRKNLLGPEPDPKLLELLDNHRQVSPETPPTFLFHTQEDASVLPENSLAFYSAMVKNKVPGELHIFQKGKHGIGLGAAIPGSNMWPDACRNWLKTREIIAE